MGREVKVAVIQMDANPAVTRERVARAEKLVRAAAEAGAHMAPVDALTKNWLLITGVGGAFSLGVGMGLGRLLGRRK